MKSAGASPATHGNITTLNCKAAISNDTLLSMHLLRSCLKHDLRGSINSVNCMSLDVQKVHKIFEILPRAFEPLDIISETHQRISSALPQLRPHHPPHAQLADSGLTADDHWDGNSLALGTPRQE